MAETADANLPPYLRAALRPEPGGDDDPPAQFAGGRVGTRPQPCVTFRTAAGVVDRTPADELAARAGAGTLTELSGIGKVTALVVTESLRGEEPVYLRRVETLGDVPVPAGAAALRAVLQDPTEADRLRRAAVAHAAGFTWDRTADLLVASWRRAVA